MSQHSHFHIDEPNNLAIEVDSVSQPALVAELIDFSSGLPAALKVVLPKANAAEALKALIDELYVNSDVYVALLQRHIDEG